MVNRFSNFLCKSALLGTTLLPLSPAIPAENAQSYTFEQGAEKKFNEYVRKAGADYGKSLEAVDQSEKDNHITNKEVETFGPTLGFEYQQAQEPKTEPKPEPKPEPVVDDHILEPSADQQVEEVMNNIEKPEKPKTNLLTLPKKTKNQVNYNKQPNLLTSGINYTFPGKKLDVDTSFYTQFRDEDITGENVLEGSRLYSQIAEVGANFQNTLPNETEISSKVLMSYRPQDSINRLLTSTSLVDPNTNYTVDSDSDIETIEKAYSNRTIVAVKHTKENSFKELALIRGIEDILTKGNVITEVRDDLGSLVEIINTPIDIETGVKSNGVQARIGFNILGGLAEIMASNEGTSLEQAEANLAYIMENNLAISIGYTNLSLTGIYHERFDDNRSTNQMKRYQISGVNANCAFSNVAFSIGKSTDGVPPGLENIEDSLFMIESENEPGGKNFYQAQVLVTSRKLPPQETFEYFDRKSRTSSFAIDKTNLPITSESEVQDYLNRNLDGFSLYINAYDQLDENMEKQTEMDLIVNYAFQKGAWRIVPGYDYSTNNKQETRLAKCGLERDNWYLAVSAGDIRPRGEILDDRESIIAFTLGYNPQARTRQAQKISQEPADFGYDPSAPIYEIK